MDTNMLLRLMTTLLALLDKGDKMDTDYSLDGRGQLNTPKYRGYMRSGKKYISVIHDIPLKATEEPEVTYNMLCEIPRWTNARMVSSLKGSLNPIFQLTDDEGELLYRKNVFPFHGYPFNFGSFPQTWTDPKRNDSKSGLPGDGEFADVVEIGSKICEFGSVIRVKLLASWATVSEGVADWKYLTINVEDEMADDLNGPDDIERLMPGFLDGFRKYFKLLDVVEGYSTIFPFNSKFQDPAYSTDLVNELHEFWRDCQTGATKCGLNLENTSLKYSKFRITQRKAISIVRSAGRKSAPAKITDPDAEKIYYVELD